jgi:succinate dehydrogenase / fumarate reductase iron-sulfur subunit/fumarate reductase iron-sulfur subunit
VSDVEPRNRRSETRGSEEKVRVTIPRSDSGAQNTFEVDRTDPTLLLDLLLAIQRRHDPSLAFRYSCRVAMCNMCGVRVDGGNVLACRVPLEAGRDEIRIEPMQGATVVRDLIVETDQFVDEWVQDVDRWSQ